MMTAAKPARSDHPIPDGWQRVRLGSIAEVLDSQRIPLSAQVRAGMAGEYPYYGANDVLDYIDRWIFDEKEDLILLAEDGGHFDEFMNRPIAYRVRGKCWVNNHAHVLKAKGCVDGGYVFRTLENKDVRLFINGTTRSKLTQGDLVEIEIALPPLPEQRAIAAVLDSIDDAIEGAEAVIAATEGLRDALLHDLLIRGLPGQHTEWRDVPGLGTIPADWEVVRLGDVAEVQTGRAVNKKSMVGGELEIPYLSVANVKDGYLDLRIVKTMLVSNTDVERYGLEKGDVLFTEGGDADKLGRGSVWRGEISPCLHQNHVFVVRPSADILIPDFLSSFASSGFGKRYFLGAAKQTTNLASVNSTQLKEMTLALPNIREQRKIVGALSAMGVSIQEATVERDNLRLLKASTAEALLTGRVRVEETKWMSTSS